METLIFYRNKPEVFKCELQIEGASHDNTIVKLCLEFDDNKNLYFYGDLNEDGICSVNIPKLMDVNKDECKLVIEAIADSTYFKVYEAEVKLKNSVDIKMKQTNSKPKTESVSQVGVKIGRLIREELVEEVEKEIEQSSIPQAKPKSGLTSFRDWKK